MPSHVKNLLAYSLTVIFEICFCKFQKENAFKNADADDKGNGHKKMRQYLFVYYMNM